MNLTDITIGIDYICSHKSQHIYLYLKSLPSKCCRCQNGSVIPQPIMYSPKQHHFTLPSPQQLSVPHFTYSLGFTIEIRFCTALLAPCICGFVIGPRGYATWHQVSGCSHHSVFLTHVINGLASRLSSKACMAYIRPGSSEANAVLFLHFTTVPQATSTSMRCVRARSGEAWEQVNAGSWHVYGCFELADLFASSLQKEAERCQYYRQ